MAVEIPVAGATPIRVDTGTSSAMETLGYTRDGAEVTLIGYYLDVKSDDNGGENGPPTDIQYMGEEARCRLELTKVDLAVLTKVWSRLRGGTAGVPGAAGTLMIGGTKYLRVLLHSVTGPMNFPCAFFREPQSVNKGTKFSTNTMEMVAYKHPVSGTLWDTSVASTT